MPARYQLPMELRHLRYFQAVAREEHFGRAAQAIRIAQPALTRQVRDLEEELGVQLFERLPRGVRLSPAGRAFLEDTNAILEKLQRSVARAKSYATGHVGSVQIGFSEIASRHPEIPAKLLQFRLDEPMVELNLLPMSSMNQIDGLRNGTVDVAIVYDIHLSDEHLGVLDSCELGSSDIVLALYEDHPLAQKTIRLQDLVDERFIFPARKPQPRYFDRLMQACLAHGFSPNIVQETATDSILLSLVAVGMGIGFTQKTGGVPRQGVVLREVEDLDVSFRLHLAWRKSDPSPAVLRFVSAMG
ncbi:LysR family transcriptional regulator [Niveispirillum sp. KHB5.9]|uniref:LysR family transcriptional regulator n=1 Tax=Niveispirillum sp. KHB5.9 TaxID=3400269 RepID=UPI003A847343